MAQRWRLDAAIRRCITVQHIEPELFPDRTPIFERRIEGLVRPAEHLSGPESRFGSALGRDVQHRSRLIAILRLHAAENDIRSFPCSLCDHIGESGRQGIRDWDTVNSKLEVCMILPNMHLLERAVDGTRNRDEDLM